MTRTIETRLRAIEDIQQIKNFKAEYFSGADGGWDGPSHDSELVASLIVDDGTWHTVGLCGLGRAAIRDIFEALRRNVPFVFHTITNPLINVDEDTATGEWHFIVLTGGVNGRYTLHAGVTTDRYVRARADGDSR